MLRRIPLLAVCVSAACADSSPPTAPILTALPSLSTSTQPDLSGSLTVPNTHDPRTTIVLGSYTAKTLATVTIEGVITLTWDYGPNSGNVYALSDPFGMYHHGQSTCYMKAFVTSTGQGSLPFVPEPCGDMSTLTSLPDVGTRPNAEGVGYFNGQVSASRPTKWFQYSSACGYGPCWTYSGSQDVSVRPIDAELTLAASASAVVNGASVTFTATVTPSSVGGLVTPFTITQWRWKPDSGTTSTPCSAPPANTNPATCTFAPTGSGTLELESVVNGSLQVKSKYISVLTCLVGDTLLDDARIRKALRTAMDSSFPNAPPLNRWERKGWRLLQPDGTVRDTLLPIGPNDSGCEVFWPASSGGTPIVAWHTHPFAPQNPNDPLPPPSHCPPLVGKPPVPHMAAPGPSPADSIAAGGIPNIVVDKREVTIIPADHPTSPYKRFPRTGPGVCDPLSA